MIEKLKSSLQLTMDELVNKVTWPTWSELQSSAIVTLVASLIVALIIFIMDSGFESLFELFYSMTK